MFYNMLLRRLPLSSAILLQTSSQQIHFLCSAKIVPESLVVNMAVGTIFRGKQLPRGLKWNLGPHHQLPMSPCSTQSGDAGQDKGYDINYCRSILRKYTCKGSTVKLETDEDSGIAVVTLNNLEKRNALSGNMMLDLADIVTELEHWSLGKGVILRGEGHFFCAGGDLDMVRDSFQVSTFHTAMSALMHDVTSRFLALPIISVALVEGKALGGGAELTTCCDFRLATESSKIGFIHLSLGVIPGWGGGTRLAKILGPAKALDVLCSARVLTSHSGLELGLVDHVIPDGDGTLCEAKEWLSQYTRWDTQVVRAAKRVIHTADNSSLIESLSTERTCFISIWGNPTHRQAVSSALKKM